MFPQIDIQDNINNTQASNTEIKKSFLFDFENGDFVLQDGKLVSLEDVEAIKIWIEKCLRTERFRFKIYEKQDKNLEYGVTIEDLIVGHDYPQAFIESELKREITASLLKNDLIESITEFKIEKNNPLLKVSFKVNLKNNTSFEQEVKF